MIIENNVPVPSDISGTRKYPFNKMQVGDSFALPVAHYKRLQRAAHAYGDYHGLKFSVRNQGETVRVWRVA